MPDQAGRVDFHGRPAPGPWPDQTRLIAASTTTLKNILSYYDIHAGLYLQGYRPENINFLSQLKMDIYVLGPCLENRLPAHFRLGRAWRGRPGGRVWACLWAILTRPVRLSAKGLKYYRNRGGRGFFFTSLGPLTREINLETLHQLVGMIRQVRL